MTTSTASNARTVKVDSQPPNAPVITSPADNSYDNDGNFTVSGTAEANSTVELSEGTTSKGTTQADGQSNWSKALSGVGQGSHTYTAKATDAAGNISGASNARTVIVDTTAPTVSVNGFTDGDKFIVGATLPTVTCTASDTGGSGVTSPTPVMTDARNANGVGTVTYTCTATDNAGNTTTVSQKLFVIYGFSGFLQPINDTAHQAGTIPDYSSFKAASTVPAKFQLTKADGTPIQALSAQWLTPAKGKASSEPVDESVYSLPATTGTLYKWDSTAQQYIYNWGTAKNQAGFYWRIGVKLDDNQTYYVNISLK